MSNVYEFKSSRNDNTDAANFYSNEVLVGLLFKSCVNSLTHSANYIDNKRFFEAATEAKKANAIIHGLSEALNHDGSEVILNMHESYVYLQKRVITCLEKENSSGLRDVRDVLNQIAHSWLHENASEYLDDSEVKHYSTHHPENRFH